MTFEEAVRVDRETALSLSRKQDTRLWKAKQAADHVLHFLRDYIDDDEKFRDAHHAFMKAMYEAEFEVVSRAQIAELERYRDAILDRAKMERLLAPVRVPASVSSRLAPLGNPPPGNLNERVVYNRDDLIAVFKAAETAWCQFPDPPDIGLEEFILDAVIPALNCKEPERAALHAIKYRTRAGSEIIVAVPAPLTHGAVRQGLFDFIMQDNHEEQCGFITSIGRFIGEFPQPHPEAPPNPAGEFSPRTPTTDASPSPPHTSSPAR